MTTKLKSTLTSLAGVALLAAAPAVAIAQTPGQQQQGHAHEGMHGTMAMGDSESTMDCQQMMAKMKQMHAKQQQMQAELDELASRMNATSGKTQQETMAELLTKLVEQRGMKQAMMQKMRPMMMQHMMGHMQSSDEGGMSGCPMMQKMQGEKGAEVSSGDDEHSQHH